MLKRKNKNQPQTRVPIATGRPASVFSYHARRSSNESTTGRGAEQIRVSTEAPWWHHLPSYIATLMIIVGVGYLLTLDIRPKFVPLTENTNNLLQPTEFYEHEGREIFAQSIMSRSKLSIDSNKLASQLREHFPELRNVSVIIPLFSRRPIVQIEATFPAFILSSQSSSYVIDTDGRAVLRVYETPSNIRDQLLVVTDDAQLPIDKGKNVLPKSTTAFITTVIRQLQAKNIPIESLSLPAAANELHVHFKGLTYYGKFDVEGDARQQAGSLIAVKQSLEQGNITPSEYIDVRIDGRAYYK
jgi:hypothetical protein